MGHRLSASIRLPAVRSEGSSVYMMRTCFEKRAFGGPAGDTIPGPVLLPRPAHFYRPDKDHQPTPGLVLILKTFGIGAREEACVIAYRSHVPLRILMFVLSRMRRPTFVARSACLRAWRGYGGHL